MSAQPFELEQPSSPELRAIPCAVPASLDELSHTQLRLRIHRLLSEVAELEEELKRRSRGGFTVERTPEEVEASWRRRTGAHYERVS